MPALTNTLRDHLLREAMKKLETDADYAALLAQEAKLNKKLASLVGKLLDSLADELEVLKRWNKYYSRKKVSIYLTDPSKSYSSPSVCCEFENDRNIPEYFNTRLAKHEFKGSAEILAVAKELLEAQQATRAVNNKTRDTLKAMLYSLSTEKQLLDVWPDAMSLLAPAASSTTVPLTQLSAVAAGQAVLAKLNKGGKRGKNKS